MAYLNWIDDEHLIGSVHRVFTKAQKILQDSEITFHKNVIDPFSAIFQINGFDLTYEDWEIAEKARQVQKSLQNVIGAFHEEILGSVTGWERKSVGGIIDLVNLEKRIIAEVKNKHNTVTGTHLTDLYKSLDDLVSPKTSVFKGYTAYFVTVLPKSKKRFNRPFVSSDRNTGGRMKTNELIRKTDGASFYELVTGSPNALHDLFVILPDVFALATRKAVNAEENSKLLNLFTQAYTIVE